MRDDEQQHAGVEPEARTCGSILMCCTSDNNTITELTKRIGIHLKQGRELRPAKNFQDVTTIMNVTKWCYNMVYHTTSIDCPYAY